MILLTSTSDLIQVITGGTQAIKVHASYVDVSGTTITPGRLNTAISSATTTTVVASPAASTQRNVKLLSIYNSDASTADTVTVQHTDGTTVIVLFKLSLLAGYTINFVDGAGWELFDNNGNLQQSAPGLSGRFLKRTVVLNGTTTFTTTSSTNTINAYLQAAGGAGGAALTATAGAHGSGGAGGGVAEWTVAVTPSTAYTCAVGAGGTGVTNANGNAGGNTTLTVGGTTCTANGGPGGLVGINATEASAGASPPAISTNGTVNGGGSPGFPCVPSVSTGTSGTGGSSGYGSGGAGRAVPGGSGTGNAAVGFGGGGGGGFSITAVAEAGGAGSNGVLIIDEFT